MKISQLAIERLNKINWFVNLGLATTPPGVIQAQFPHTGSVSSEAERYASFQ